MSKYGIFSAPDFSTFGLKTRKYGPEKTPYLDNFNVVQVQLNPTISNKNFRDSVIFEILRLGLCKIQTAQQAK